MIRDNSPFRRLPAGLPKNQYGYLQGLRYAFDIFGAASERLMVTLKTLALVDDLRPPAALAVDPFSFAMADAWAVVDAAWRLKRFVVDGRIPRPPGRDQPKERSKLPRGDFPEVVKCLKNMRDGFQHLDGHCVKEAEANRSVWGTLRWVVLLPDQATLRSCVLVAGGTRLETESFDLVNPAGKAFHPPIDHVELSAFGQVAPLSTVIRSATTMLQNFEAGLEPAFKDQPSGGLGFLVKVDMTAEPTESTRIGRGSPLRDANR